MQERGKYMRLTDEDIIEQYKAMQSEHFFQNTVKELKSLYEYYLQDGAFLDKKSCASGASAFIYNDDNHLIEASEPDKVRIVLAIAVFLIDGGFSSTLMTRQMSEDLSWILSGNMVKKLKRYYNKDDYKIMLEYVPYIKDWAKRTDN